MKNIQELETFYEQDLKADLERLEIKRKQIFKRGLNTFLSIVGLILLAVVTGYAFAGLIFGIFFVGIIILMIATVPTYNKLKKGFKNDIVKKLIHFIDDSLQYDPGRSISKNDFVNSKLFSSYPNKYKGDDFVWGKIDKTAIRFSEVFAQRKHTDSKGRTTYSTIFKGLFLIADFNKKFEGETFIIPNNSAGIFSGLSRWTQSISRPSSVKMEDVEFNKAFNVYASDRTEAFYLLTPVMMQYIKDFRAQNTKRPFSISFTNASINIAISISKDLFEPSLFKNLVNIDQIKEYYEDLYLAISIVEEFNLNNRIWSKA